MTTIAQGNKRLLKLASVLDTADAEHRKRGEPAYNQRDTTSYDEKRDCETPGCAWGHYRVIPFVVRRLGKMASLFESNTEFALNWEQHDELFASVGCKDAKTAKQAANYIRAFVKRRS